MNPRIQLPGIIERYQEIFLEETSGEHASMASLYAQVFMQSDDGTDFSLADRFLEQIEEMIEDATSKESLQRLGESCMDISIDQWIQSPEAARRE